MKGRRGLFATMPYNKDLQIEPPGNVFRRYAIAIYDRLNQHTNRLLTDEEKSWTAQTSLTAQWTFNI
jgi:hypothetical protein